MAVAAVTLCAPLVAMLGLAAIGVAGGGKQAEMGTLAGAQGLRGTTVAATNPVPTQVSGPTTVGLKAKASQTGEGAPSEPKRHPTQDTASNPQGEPAPTTRAPSHKPPVHTAPEPPSNLNPSAPAPPTSTDPSTPGAPTSGSTSGTSGSTSGTSGSTSGTSGSTSGTSGSGTSGASGGTSGTGTSGSTSGSGSGTDYPSTDYPDQSVGQSGGG